MKNTLDIEFYIEWTFADRPEMSSIMYQFRKKFEKTDFRAHEVVTNQNTKTGRSFYSTSTKELSKEIKKDIEAAAKRGKEYSFSYVKK